MKYLKSILEAIRAFRSWIFLDANRTAVAFLVFFAVIGIILIWKF
jgi:hypothetical protein